MARQISRAEAWERAHEIFTQVNFNSFDYNSIKQSLIDYMKLYFPEDFNDYIETNEFIAILEMFAYIGELLAYRVDLNAHENFITTAQRKESILRLAKLISYKASRNIPARGLVKLTSIQTTELVYDAEGRNLSGRRIIWNDANNASWKEQFLLIMNRVMEQEFGSVTPNERVQVDDVLFELYTLSNNPLAGPGRNVFSYSASSSGQSFPLELVPVTLTADGPEEKRPEVDAKFTLLYANDGLGDGSDTTGFLMFTKQGTLQRQQAFFDGVTPNQTYDVATSNINETDLWLNNVDATTRAILTEDPIADLLPHLVAEDARYGEWIEVDLANAQNILFNTNANRHKYEVETLDDDQIRLVFGDGEFSDIPSGAFDIWYRISANSDLAIAKSSVVDQNASFTYIDATGTTQTVTFSFSLISSLQNGSASETLEHIRRVAPSVYYTQDRMVNGRDYNTFMLQDPSILRLRAVNRTFAGDSKYIAWHDPRENYEDVKMFGDDLALYWVENDPNFGNLTVVSSPIEAPAVLENYIEPLLSSSDIFAIVAPILEDLGIPPTQFRRTFNTAITPYVVVPTGQPDNETDAIIEALNTAATTGQDDVELYYSATYDEWTVGPHPCDVPGTDPGCTGAADAIWLIRVEATFEGSTLSGWNIRWGSRRLVAQSQQTNFWNTNATNNVVNFDTLDSNFDRIVLLQANVNAKRDGLLDGNLEYSVLSQLLLEQNSPNAGLPDTHRLSVLPADTNEDGLPDNLLQEDIFHMEVEQEYQEYTEISPGVIEVPNGRSYLQGYETQDIEVYKNGTLQTFGVDWNIPTGWPVGDLVVDEIEFASTPLATDIIKLVVYDYVYFSRESSIDSWEPQAESDDIKELFLADDTSIEDERRYTRRYGRYPMNFAWFHTTPRLHLVDPAASNIIDIFIVTRGYYTSLVRWLENKVDDEPVAPTSLELRTSYSDLLDNKMISDTVILHPGKFKILFGSRAIPELRCTFKIVRPASTSLTDNEVKVQVVELIRKFFELDYWEFGETFFFTELAASIHHGLGPEIDSVVLVPTLGQNQFGDMFQVQSREDELFIPDINTSDIEIIESLTSDTIRQNES